MEIICPLIHTRVRIQIPNTSDDDWKAFTRDYIINQCSRAMKDSFAWKTLMQLPISSGRKLELGWRSGNRLDWVWLRNSVEGQKRDWEVLYGLALQNVSIAFGLTYTFLTSTSWEMLFNWNCISQNTILRKLTLRMVCTSRSLRRSKAMLI